MNLPDSSGFFGEYGGRFVPENLIKVLDEVKQAFYRFKDDPDFQKELDYYFKYFVGRPSPLYYAERLTKQIGGAKIYLKREDLNHMGAHKINNTIGQVLLAKRLGKKGSLQKQEPDSMVLLLHPHVLYLKWNALFIWAKKHPETSIKCFQDGAFRCKSCCCKNWDKYT
jgi:hypothetical protein